MDSKFIVLGVVVVLVIAVVAFSLMNGGSAPQNNTVASTTVPVVTTVAPVNVTNTTIVNTTNTTNSTGVTNVTNSTVSNGSLFNQSQYFSHSTLISTAVLTPQARATMADFTLSTTLENNGSSIYNLTVVSTNSSTLITVLPGQALYFIDNLGGDDQGNVDSNLGDDGYAVVNANGTTQTLVYPISGS